MIVEIFKSWISSMLCIGIFIAFVQLMMPKTNLKKYIYSLIGIVTILTVVSPIINMFENDRSAARGKMCLRKLYIFKHDSALGNAPAHILFDKIKVENVSDSVPRSFSDYKITVDDAMPSGVELIEKI